MASADLVRAIQSRDEKGVKMLLSSRRVQQPDVSGELDEVTLETTALIEAILVGSSSMVNALLDAGADVDAGSPHAVSPLCVAAAIDNLSMAKLLLLRGANIGHLSDNRPLCQVTTPLHYAIEMGSLPMAKLLLSHGHDPNHPSQMYKYPLTEAIRQNFPGVVQLLVKSPLCQVDGMIDGYGTWEFPPLHQALFRYRRYKIAQVLIDSTRCRLSFHSDSYLCVLLWRVRDTRHRHLRVACMLLEAGTDLDWHCRDRQGQRAFMSFITGNRTVDIPASRSLLRLIVDAGITPSALEVTRLREHANSTADEEFCDWLEEVATSPRSLKDQVRRVVREKVGLFPMKTLSQLPLPPILTDFVTLRYLRDYQ